MQICPVFEVEQRSKRLCHETLECCQGIVTSSGCGRLRHRGSRRTRNSGPDDDTRIKPRLTSGARQGCVEDPASGASGGRAGAVEKNSETTRKSGGGACFWAYFREFTEAGSAGTAGIGSGSDRSFFLLRERMSQASLPTAREMLLPLLNFFKRKGSVSIRDLGRSMRRQNRVKGAIARVASLRAEGTEGRVESSGARM